MFLQFLSAVTFVKCLYGGELDFLMQWYVDTGMSAGPVSLLKVGDHLAVNLAGGLFSQISYEEDLMKIGDREFPLLQQRQSTARPKTSGVQRVMIIHLVK
jgi:hypothetical protein